MDRSESDLTVIVPRDRIDLKETVREVTGLAERQIIQRVLKKENGNRTRTAEVLGVSRRSLLTKISQYGLDKADG